MFHFRKTLLLGSLSFLLSACYAMQPDSDKQPAGAMLSPTKNERVTGWVQFIPEDIGKTRVKAEIRGLLPGAHGFHIHQYGDCSAPDGSSAGGHFSPGDSDHGSPASGDHHTGDLGNIMADVNGVARMDKLFDHLTLKGKRSIVGRGVIVHQKPDDLNSQPSGDAGPRVACGVIGMLPISSR